MLVLCLQHFTQPMFVFHVHMTDDASNVLWGRQCFIKIPISGGDSLIRV